MEAPIGIQLINAKNDTGRPPRDKTSVPQRSPHMWPRCIPRTGMQLSDRVCA
jgi:hypothetical protein